MKLHHLAPFLMVLSSGLMAQTAVDALPSGGKVAMGQATINQTGNTMNVVQASQRAVINWDSFNVGAQAKVEFVQPNAQASTLNRVASVSATQIDGMLKANGQVVIANANGVVFGKSAQVDVGSMVATTMNINDKDFMDGKSTYKGNGQGSVVNYGKIQTNDPKGYIALLAPEVRNEGYILARGGAGAVALASGSQVTLDFRGDQLMTVKVDAAAYKSLIENKRLVQVDGGLVVIAANSAAQLMGSVIKNSGRITTSSMVNNGGVIEILADTVHNQGSITANAKGEQGNGGQINIRGNQITLADTSKIKANAKTQGHGGQIIILSNEKTYVSGLIEAKGGKLQGNGGFVDTSSKKILEISGTAKVDTSASNGRAGTWLLDPMDLTITTDSARVINAALQNNNVTIEVQGNVCSGGSCTQNGSGNLTIAQGVTITKTGTIRTSLTFIADGTFYNYGTITQAADSLLDVIIQAKDVNFALGSQIEANTVTVTATQTVTGYGTIRGQGVNSLVNILAQVFNFHGVIAVNSNTQQGGTIRITAQDLTLNPNSRLEANGYEGGVITLSANQTGTIHIEATVQTNGSNGRGGAINISQAADIHIHQAIIQANGENGGNIQIFTDSGDLILQNTLIQTNGSNGRGGSMGLSATNHTIIQNSNIEAKGFNQGGTLLIGNDANNGTLPFSIYTDINSNTIISTDSIHQQNNNFVGGFIETSAHTLNLLGTINAGRGGMWLIDPVDIYIGNSSNHNILNTVINTALQTSDVTINSTGSGSCSGVSCTTLSGSYGDIWLLGAIDKSGSTSTTLTLIAHRSILINAPITNSGSGSLSVVLTAGGEVQVNQPISVKGSLEVTSANQFTTAYLTNVTANNGITKVAGGGLTSLGGDLITSNTPIRINGNLLIRRDVSLTSAGGDITITGSVSSITTAVTTYTSSGTSTFTTGVGVTSVEVMVIGGGGSGGGSVGGGGGAGGVVYYSVYGVSASTSYTVRVGGGGAGAAPSGNGNVGGDSAFGSILAVGGGGGGNASNSGSGAAPDSGGSGGGGQCYGAGNCSSTGASGSVSQGNAGGSYVGTYNLGSGGGGGGALTAGSNSTNNGIGGNGGDGVSYAITGSSVTYATGGGGVGHNGSNNGLGGSNNINGNAATNGGSSPGAVRANTGSGGGGQWLYASVGNSQAGSSGIVVVRYVTSGGSSLTIDAGGGTSMIAGSVSGSTALIKNGIGRLNLTGSNTYTGGTTVTAGTLGIYKNDSLGSGTLTLSTSTTLLLGRAVTNIQNAINLTGNATIDLDTSVEYLVVGGGGGGGAHVGGGGGGGGVLTGFLDATLNSYGVLVGSGGSGGVMTNNNWNTPTTSAARNGGSSSLGSLTALGGGGGGQWTYIEPNQHNLGTPVASGGGSGDATSGGAGTAGQGFAGGSGDGTSNYGYQAGGGGGAGGAGQSFNYTTGGTGSGGSGKGGVGLLVAWAGSLGFGQNGYFGGGGGGGLHTSMSAYNAGAGGLGGGGSGSEAATPATSGSPNTGGGGGGAGLQSTQNSTGGNGGSGIVIVRYLGASAATAGGTTTKGEATAGSGSASGYTLHTFTDTGSSTLTFGNLEVTLSGMISGSGRLAVNAAGGKITLTQPNTYSGGTSVLGGLVIAGIASTGAITNGPFGTGTVTINSGYTVDLNGFNVANAFNLSGTGINSDGALINSSSTAVSVSGTITLADNSSVGGAGNITLSGDLLGSYGLTKVGANTLTLTGVTNGTTTTTISVGTLKIGNSGTSGALGSGVITNNGSLIIDRSNAITVTNDISGSGSLTKNGSGTLTLTGTNTYAGASNINVGTLEVSGTGKLGNGNYTSALTVGASGVFTFSSSSDQTFTNIATGAGTVNLNGSGTVTISGDQDFTGTINVAQNVTMTGGSNAPVAGLGNATAININYGGTITMATTSDHNGFIGNGFRSGLTLTINAGGTLTSATGSTDTFHINPGSFILNGGTLAWGGSSPSQWGSWYLGSAITVNNDSTISARFLTLRYGGGTSFNVASGKTLTISGTIISSTEATSCACDAEPLKINSSGATGTVVLGGNNTYKGDTSISAGTLKLTGSLSNSTDVIMSNGAIWDLQVTQTIATLTMASGNSITRSTGTSSLTISGVSTIANSITTSGTQTY
ncbi:filamentous hemagglutinin N-terminal domain-containing protein, partial [Polynucleobacter sp. MWH-Loch1C5]|uniref:glycine-rich domain-containing protein n=1 Tax=Polynucleobacter sp. MWH-Loch1C5 TaxID=2689108 RepID=UPI001C0B385B